MLHQDAFSFALDARLTAGIAGLEQETGNQGREIDRIRQSVVLQRDEQNCQSESLRRSVADLDSRFTAGMARIEHEARAQECEIESLKSKMAAAGERLAGITDSLQTVSQIALAHAGSPRVHTVQPSTLAALVDEDTAFGKLREIHL